MADNNAKITTMNDGPLLVEGNFTICDQNGNEFNTGGREKVALCRCGGSGMKPFCDGSHKKGFDSKLDAKEAAK